MHRQLANRVLAALPRWARRPVLPALLLAVAVAVSVAHGQPPPADRASGVSVPVSAANDVPSGLGDLLVVSAGGLTRFDVETGTTTPVPLPRGRLALRAWPMRDADVVLTGPVPTGGAGSLGPMLPVPLGTAPPAPVLPRPGHAGAGHSGAGHSAGGQAGTPSATGQPDGTATPPADPATAAYAIPHRGATVLLGPATAVVPSTDGDHVWLLHGDVARLVDLDGQATPTWVRVPPGYRLVGATRRGPVASVAGAHPLTVLLPADGGLPHWLANADALDVANGTVLLHDDHRIASLRLSTGAVHWLPALSAVQITGPGTLSPGGGSFAVQARVNEHARLVVGQLNARSGDQLRVVALEGGIALDHPPAPVWTEDGQVLAVRPDGRMVVYRAGDAQASVLSAQYQASGVAAVAPGDGDLPR